MCFFQIITHQVIIPTCHHQQITQMLVLLGKRQMEMEVKVARHLQTH